MIDIENMVFDTISKAVKAEYPNAAVYGEYVDIPAAFPCVTLVEEDNTVYRKTQDEEEREHHATLMYTINIYCNKANGKRAEAKAIAKIVDDAMQSLKFTRTVKNQIPNADRSIYRMILRYTAVVAEGYTSTGGNTVYQMYRK